MSDPKGGSPLHRQAVGMLVLATVCWALSFPVMKALALAQHQLVAQEGSWFFTSLGICYRFGGAGLFTLAVLCWRRELPNRLELEQGLKIATFGTAGILFQMDGLSYIDASTSAFLTQGYCLFIPVWVALSNRRWPGMKIFVSTILVLAGVGMLAGVNFHSWKFGRGEWETLLASLLFTGQILLLERPRFKSNRPLQFSMVMFLAIALYCVPVVLLTAPNAAACWRAYSSPSTLGFLLMLITVCTLVAYVLMNQWQKHVSATEAGLIYCAEPLFASCLCLFLPGLFGALAGVDYSNESVTQRLLLGGGLITAANVWLQSRWLNPPTANAAA
jgi:drug/metabolite transporter (DMT)-like permease